MCHDCLPPPKCYGVNLYINLWFYSILRQRSSLKDFASFTLSYKLPHRLLLLLFWWEKRKDKLLLYACGLRFLNGRWNEQINNILDISVSNQPNDRNGRYTVTHYTIYLLLLLFFFFFQCIRKIRFRSCQRVIFS